MPENNAFKKFFTFLVVLGGIGYLLFAILTMDKLTEVFFSYSFIYCNTHRLYRNIFPKKRKGEGKVRNKSRLSPGIILILVLSLVLAYFFLKAKGILP